MDVRRVSKCCLGLSICAYPLRKIATSHRTVVKRKHRHEVVVGAEGGAGGDFSQRAQDLLQRAAALRKEQEALAAEFAATVSDSEGHKEIESLLKDEGLRDILAPKGVYNPDLGEIPSGILRSELERLLGLRPSEDEDDPLAKGPQFEEAEELARAIEEGTGTMEAPPGYFVDVPEPAEEFLARLEASVARFEEMLLSKKEQARLRRERKAAGVYDDADDDEDSFRKVLNDIPMFPEDLTQSVPAPTIPQEAAEQFHRAERVLLVLRRVLKTDGIPPISGLNALLDRDLVSDDVYFEDPWAAMNGIDAVQEYLEVMGAVGATLDLEIAFSSYYEYKPDVRCRIIAHTLMRMPLPLWYLVYLGLHGQPPPPPNPATKPRRQPHETIRIELGEHNSPPEVLFPRNPMTTSEAEEMGTAHVPWMRWPIPIALKTQVIVPNPGSIIIGEQHEELNGIIDFEPAGCIKPLNQVLNDTSAFFPDYSALPSSAAITSVDGTGWLSPRRVDPPLPPPLPRPLPANLETDPMTPDEAEQLLRELLGDEYDAIAKRLPAKAEVPGPSDEEKRELRVGATWVYDVDPRSGQVASIELHWGWVAGPMADVTHAYDIYLTECGLTEREML